MADPVLERVPSELADAVSEPPRYEIATYPADYTLEVLYSQWQGGDIEIPKFQRQFVWTQIQASRLIESFLLGLPVPGIFLYTERASQKFLVVDGQQRLRSIFYFFDGSFGEEHSGRRKVFRLKGLSEASPFHEKTYKELENDDEASARRLRNSVLRAFIIRQLNPDDDTSVYHIFERLNTGGTLLHNQEVRNCVYGGSFNDLLLELNHLPRWRKIFGREALDTRQRDVELILRFFALLHALDEYETPMKDFLSRFMKRNQNASPRQISQFREEFTNVVDAVFGTLRAKPFHIWSGLNSSTYDAVFTAYALHNNQTPGDIRSRYKRFTSLQELEELVRAGTTDVDRVKGRIALASRRLFE